MNRQFALLTALLPATLLGACGVPDAYRGLESEHQPVVTRSDYAIDLRTDGSGLAAGEAERLAGWMAALNLGYGDSLHSQTNGYADAVDADVARTASRFGMTLDTQPPLPVAPLQPGTVRVTATKMRAAVPGCPATTSLDQPNFDSHTSVNFGCAINSNLAAMVARPEDLVRGQAGSGVSDPDTAIKAIDSWRRAPPTGEGGLQKESTRSGGGSSSGGTSQ